MSAIPLLDGHRGRRCAPARRTLAARILSFLRPVPAAEEERAAPVPRSGAARTYARPDGVITVEGDGSVTVRALPDDTRADLPLIPRYLDARPEGTS